MYQTLANRLREALHRYIREKYGAELEIVLGRPPKLEMGGLAVPTARRAAVYALPLTSAARPLRRARDQRLLTAARLLAGVRRAGRRR